jgi:hypothetical protein
MDFQATESSLLERSTGGNPWTLRIHGVMIDQNP